jgi:hypothetical protein
MPAAPTCPYCKGAFSKETKTEGGFYRKIFVCGTAYNEVAGKKFTVQSLQCKRILQAQKQSLRI